MYIRLLLQRSLEMQVNGLSEVNDCMRYSRAYCDKRKTIGDSKPDPVMHNGEKKERDEGQAYGKYSGL